MIIFDKAVEHVLEREKGFVNHPLDKGGPTSHGLTLRTLSEYLGRQATVEDVKKVTPSFARLVYYKLYWQRGNLTGLPVEVAIPLFDQMVNRGVHTATKTLQRSLGISQDGILGPVTKAAISKRSPRIATVSFLAESSQDYIRIVEADPSQIVFLRGWMDRVFALVAEYT